MTDKQFEDRCDVLIKLLSAIDPNASVAKLSHDIAEVKSEIAEVRKHLSHIERSIKTIKTLVG
jgi:predicted  nucleic acid-binding Zn-ribbon protein